MADDIDVYALTRQMRLTDTYDPSASYHALDDAADVLVMLRDERDAARKERDEALREMHARELHHFEEEQRSAGLAAVIERTLAAAPKLGESLHRGLDRMILELRGAPADALNAVKAEALREAADAWQQDGWANPAAWLRLRADRIEKGGRP